MSKNTKEVVDDATGEVYSLNTNFTQVSNDVWDDLGDLVDKAPLASRILFYFIKHMNRRNTIAIMQKDLCLAVSRERNAVSKALAELKRMRYIAFERNGNSFIYHVNVQVCWRASAGEKAAAFLNQPLRKAKVIQEVAVKHERKSVAVVRVKSRKNPQDLPATNSAFLEPLPSFNRPKTLKEMVANM